MQPAGPRPAGCGSNCYRYLSRITSFSESESRPLLARFRLTPMVARVVALGLARLGLARVVASGLARVVALRLAVRLTPVLTARAAVDRLPLAERIRLRVRLRRGVVVRRIDPVAAVLADVAAVQESDVLAAGHHRRRRGGLVRLVLGPVGLTRRLRGLSVSTAA